MRFYNLKGFSIIVDKQKIREMMFCDIQLIFDIACVVNKCRIVTHIVQTNLTKTSLYKITTIFPNHRDASI